MMTIKEIKSELLNGNNMEFSIKGFEGRIFRMVCMEEGKNTAVASTFEQMNINKFGPTCMTLYTFNMMGKKTIGKIKYSDVTIIGPRKEKKK